MDIQRVTRAVNGVVLWVTRHWLAVANLALAAVLGLAFLAPLLMLHGQEGAGRLLYLAYQPLCHQLPERSFFLGGPRLWYSLDALRARLGCEPPQRYAGDPRIGYATAFCQRDVAIFAGYLLTGLAYALFRRRMRSLPWRVVALATVPIFVDGMLQLVGLLESDPLRRSVTGLLFGVAATWFVFPFVDQGMSEAHEIAQNAEVVECPHQTI